MQGASESEYCMHPPDRCHVLATATSFSGPGLWMSFADHACCFGLLMKSLHALSELYMKSPTIREDVKIYEANDLPPLVVTQIQKVRGDGWGDR